MGADQTGNSNLEQRLVTNIFADEKSKPCEIYKYVLLKKKLKKTMFTNGLNVSLARWVWAEKTVHGVKTHWISRKWEVLGAMFNERNHAASILGHENTNIIILL